MPVWRENPTKAVVRPHAARMLQYPFNSSDDSIWISILVAFVSLDLKWLLIEFLDINDRKDFLDSKIKLVSPMSPLQQFRSITQTGAVFTVAWPCPFVIRGNVGESVLQTPPDLRTVTRVTSSAIYYAKGDGSETRGDFPKAHLIEKRGDGFVIYDPAYTTGGMKEEIPGQRGKVNRVYWPGNRVEAVTAQIDWIGRRFKDHDWTLDLIASRSPEGQPSITTLFLADSTDQVRMVLDSAGKPLNAAVVQHIGGVEFETPIVGKQLRDILLSARFKAPEDPYPQPVLWRAHQAWQELAVGGHDEMRVPMNGQNEMLKLCKNIRIAKIADAEAFVVDVATEKGDQLILRAQDSVTNRRESYILRYCGGEYRVDVAPLLESDTLAALTEHDAGLVIRTALFADGSSVLNRLQNRGWRKLALVGVASDEAPLPSESGPATSPKIM